MLTLLSNADLTMLLVHLKMCFSCSQQELPITFTLFFRQFLLLQEWPSLGIRGWLCCAENYGTGGTGYLPYFSYLAIYSFLVTVVEYYISSFQSEPQSLVYYAGCWRGSAYRCFTRVSTYRFPVPYTIMFFIFMCLIVVGVQCRNRSL